MKPTIDDNDTDAVIVRQYGLLTPVNWKKDVDDELWRMNRLWNKLVEIERDNRERYRQIVSASPALADITAQIGALQEEREALILDRNRRRAAVRSKAKANTAEQDTRIKDIKAELAPLYGEAKALAAEARGQQKPQLDSLELQRKEAVKQARQQSGLFWSNYNAVIDAYNSARQKALKEGAELKFRRFGWEGRLVNQIQGGLSVEDLFACKHSQVGIRLAGESRGRPAGVLYVTAYTGRDAGGKHLRRVVDFPIILHRPIPDGALIKSVSVNIRRCSPTLVRRPIGLEDGAGLERGIPEYSVTFTCRAPGEGNASGTAAAGLNIGWKRVVGGLRVATVAFSDGGLEHLILRGPWIAGVERVKALKSSLDDATNAIHEVLRQALKHLPVWSEDGPRVEGLCETDHRLLSVIKRAPKAPARAMDTLAWRLKEVSNMPFVSVLAEQIEVWRKSRKRKTLEMDGLRSKLTRQRKDLYRVFAKHLVDRAGAVALDATSYRAAAQVRRPDGEDTDLHQLARTQRVMAAPFELRLAIEQAFMKRGGRVERYAGEINRCESCGSKNITGELILTCHQCGNRFDVDENAARNLLATLIAEPARAVG